MLPQRQTPSLPGLARSILDRLRYLKQDGSTLLDSPTGLSVLAGATGVVLAANAYYDGVSWFRRDTGGTAYALAVLPDQTVEYWTAASGTGAISWTVASLGDLAALTLGDFTNATHDHESSAGGGTLDAAAIAAGNLGDARLPADSGGADANGWEYEYIAPGRKRYHKAFAVGSAGAVADELAANDAALPVGVSTYASLWVESATVEASAGGSRLLAQCRQGTGETLDVAVSTTDGSNISSKVSSYTVTVTVADK